MTLSAVLRRRMNVRTYQLINSEKHADSRVLFRGAISEYNETWTIVFWLAINASLIIDRLVIEEEDIGFCVTSDVGHVVHDPATNGLGAIFTVLHDMLVFNGEASRTLKYTISYDRQR